MIVEHRDASAALRRLAVPSALALSADQLLGIVDTIVVGGLGATALAGITAAGSVVIVLIIALSAFGSGARIVSAQAIGAGEAERVGVIVRSSLIVPLAVVAAATLLAGLFGGYLMRAMLHGIPIVEAAAGYLTLRTFSALPMVIDVAAISAFSAAGDNKPMLRLLVAINLVHIPLVIVLTHGAGAWHGMGLVGAGLSSLLSEVFGVAYILVVAHRHAELRLTASASVDPALIRLTTRLALPQFIFLILMVLPEPVTVALLSPYGAPVVGGFRALSMVSDLSWSLPGALGDAAEVVLGQRLGARDVRGARTFRVAATRRAVAVCAIAGLAVAIFAWPLAALFTLNPAIASLAAAPLAVHMTTLPLKGFAMTVLAPIRAAGDVAFTMWMGIATGVIAIGGIALGVDALHLGLWSIALAWILAWTFRCVLTLRRLRTGDWERRTLAA